MKIFKLILYVLFGLMFINAGLNKFFNYLPLPEFSPVQIKFFTAFTSIVWLMPLVAIVEIVGGILFILKKTRALGAIFILPVMTGVLVHHVVTDQSGLILSLVLMAINVLALADNWGKYQNLLEQEKQ
jgi:uncharacterized membrane protein YphA (DoxX/SURF4 family)